MMAFLPAPIRLSIDVTSDCNLHCVHCRQAKKIRKGTDLAFDEICRIIDDADKMGVFRLTFSGGEPLLREDIIEILLYALRSSVGRVFLSTNGLLLNRHNLHLLMHYRKRLTFKLSLDGPPEVHDQIRRQPGACKETQAAIALLTAHGFNVQISTTLTHQTVPYIEQLVASTSRIGCTKHYFIEIVPVGNATPAMMLPPDQRKRVAQMIRCAAAKYASRNFVVIAKLPFVDGKSSGLRCIGGIEKCGILADGSVVGCRLIPNIVEGNVRKRPFRDLWNDPHAFGVFRQLQPFRLQAPCKTCARSSRCRGGCHAVAGAVFGDTLAPDPRCPHVAQGT